MNDPISLSRLAWAFVPVFIFLALLAWQRRPLGTSLQGLARMLIQLLLVGYGLVHLFEANTPWIPLAVLSVMLLAASAIALRTAKVNKWSRFVIVIVSIGIGGGGTLAIMTTLVLDLTPWFSPRVLIPLAGMTFSSSLNAISLATERLDSLVERGMTLVDAAEESLNAALIPITNSLFAVGVVSIPGMMTGQVLAGVSPLLAARYQIMIMCLIFASAGLSVSVYLWADRRWGKQPKQKAQSTKLSDST